MTGPPRLAIWLLTRRLSADWRDFVVGDLEEEFGVRSGDSPLGRHAWFWWQTLRCLVAPPPVRPNPPLQRSKGGSTMRTFMDKAIQDARHALRRMRRSLGFTIAALLTLALGIGANALIFSAVNAVFLRPLSYHDPDRLVWVTEFFPKFNRSTVLIPDYVAWKRQNALFEGIEAMSTTGANLSGAGRPAERVQAAHVTPGFFAMLGISPQQGSGFDPADGATGLPMMVISDRLWRGYLQADPGILGKSVNLNATEFTVIGVMPPDFIHPDGAEVAVWLSDAVPPAATVPSRRPQSVHVIGKLKHGVTVEQVTVAPEKGAILAGRKGPAVGCAMAGCGRSDAPVMSGAV